MSTQPDLYVRQRSTTRWIRDVKMSEPPKGRSALVRRTSRWGRLSRRNPREWMTIRIRYTGGGECYYWVKARGEQGIFGGHTTLHDAMIEINGEYKSYSFPD